jgi:glycosyltransferase involved in cell wall biosynthesis
MIQSFILVKSLTPKKRDMVVIEQVAGLPLMLMIRMFHRRKIIIDDMTLLHIDYDFMPKPLLKLIDIMCIGVSDLVVTTTEKTVDFVAQTAPRKLCIKVENGVDSTELLSSTQNIPKSDQLVRMLFVGGLGFHQNRDAIRHILRIVEILSEMTSRFVVTIVGGPISEATEFLKHQMVKKGFVKFTGFLSNNELDVEFSRSLVGLLPFFEDSQLMAGQRTKALEYFARRLLVVSGPEGVGEINGIEPGRSYVETPDDLSFAKALKEIVNDSAQFESMRDYGYDTIRERYSWESTTGILHDSIQKLFL